MSRVPDEDRTWKAEEAPEKDRSALEALRAELRRRSELTRLFRSLTRDYRDQG